MNEADREKFEEHQRKVTAGLAQLDQMQASLAQIHEAFVGLANQVMEKSREVEELRKDVLESVAYMREQGELMKRQAEGEDTL